MTDLFISHTSLLRTLSLIPDGVHYRDVLLFICCITVTLYILFFFRQTSSFSFQHECPLIFVVAICEHKLLFYCYCKKYILQEDSPCLLLENHTYDYLRQSPNQYYIPLYYRTGNKKDHNQLRPRPRYGNQKQMIKVKQKDVDKMQGKRRKLK